MIELTSEEHQQRRIDDDGDDGNSSSKNTTTAGVNPQVVGGWVVWVKRVPRKLVVGKDKIYLEEHQQWRMDDDGNSSSKNTNNGE